MKIILSIEAMDQSFQKMIIKLNEYAEVIVTDLENYDLTDCDVFIGKKLKEEKLINANKLKAIFAYKTGVDDFPLEALAEKNIKLINSHADSDIIAEYAFGLSIALVNRINEFDLNLREGIWYDNDNMYWKSFFEMKVGLFGYGHIGKAIHNILKTNHVKTYTIDRGHNYQDIELVSSLEELIKISDIIICSVPKKKHTNNVFNEETFKLMKGKFIVNVGRSNIISQEDLYNNLLNEYLGGAAIDTWHEKPKNKRTKLMPSSYPFEKLRNIVLSPHAAMRVSNGHERYVSDVTRMVINYIEKQELINIVDLQKGY